MAKVKINRIGMIVLTVLFTITIFGCGLPGGVESGSGKENEYQYLVSSQSTSFEDNRTPVEYEAKNYEEIRAVWISYIELQTLLRGKDRSSFTSAVQEAYRNIAGMGLNTVIVQVRPYGDAIYPSPYFPWSSFAKAYGIDPGYDPLSVLIEEAHKLGLSFHAWVNPYRAQTEEEAAATPDGYPFSKWYHGKEKGKYIVSLNGRWYYNPGIEEVRQLIISGIREMVQYYEVDGVHMDDYFYPTTDTNFDSEQYQQYQTDGGTLELEAWRRENVNALLRDAYLAVKKINDGVLFGVSPQANISNNFNTQYADVIRWCSTAGYLDYICPQIYYNFKSETTDFSTALEQWIKIAVQPSVRLLVGVAPYKIGKEDKWACTAANGGQCSAPNDCGAMGWMVSDQSNSSLLKQQYEKIKSEKRCSGIVFYSYNSLFSPDSAVKRQIESEISQLKTAFARTGDNS